MASASPSRARLGRSHRPREGDDRDIPDSLGRDSGGARRRAHPRRAPASSAAMRCRSANARSRPGTSSSPPAHAAPAADPGAELMITSDEVLSERELPRERGLHRRRRDRARVRPRLCARRHQGHHSRSSAAPPARRSTRTRSAQIRAESERIGIAVHTGVKVERVEKTGNGFVPCSARTARSRRSLPTGWSTAPAASPMSTISISMPAASPMTGSSIARRRAPPLDLEPCRLCLRRRAVGPPQLSPLATYEGRIVGRNIVEGAEAQARLCEPSVRRLHRAGAGERRAHRGASQGEGPQDQGHGQRHGGLVLDADLCRDRGLGEGDRR